MSEKETGKFVMLTSRVGPGVNDEVGDIVSLELGEGKEADRMMNASPPQCRPVRDGANPELTVNRRRRQVLAENMDALGLAGRDAERRLNQLNIDECEARVSKAKKAVGKDKKKASDEDLDELSKAEHALAKEKRKAEPIIGELEALSERFKAQQEELEKLEKLAKDCDPSEAA